VPSGGSSLPLFAKEREFLPLEKGGAEGFYKSLSEIDETSSDISCKIGTIFRRRNVR
jgi:hypothetical protein